MENNNKECGLLTVKRNQKTTKPIQVFGIGALILIIGIFSASYVFPYSLTLISLGLVFAGGLVVMGSCAFWVYEKTRHPQEVNAEQSEG